MRKDYTSAMIFLSLAFVWLIKISILVLAIWGLITLVV